MCKKLIGKLSLIAIAYYAAIQFIESLSFTIFASNFRYSDSVIGILIALINGLPICVLPWLGKCSDRYFRKDSTRKSMLILELSAAAIAVLGIYLSLKAKSTIGVTGSMILLSCVVAQCAADTFAELLVISDEKTKKTGNIIVRLMTGFGGILTFVLVTIFSKNIDTGDYSGVLLGLAVTLVAGLAAAFLLDSGSSDDTLKEDRAGDEAKHFIKPFYFLLAITITSYCAYYMMSMSFIKYAAAVLGLTSDAASIFMIVIAVSVIGGYVFMGTLCKKTGYTMLGIISVFVMAIMFAVVAFMTHGSIWLYVAFIVLGISWSGINLCIVPLISESVHAKQLGSAMSCYYTCVNFSKVIAPILCGVIMQHINFRIILICGCVLCGIAFFVFILFRRERKRCIS